MKTNTANLNWPKLINKPWHASNIWEADDGMDSPEQEGKKSGKGKKMWKRKKKQNQNNQNLQISKVKKEKRKKETVYCKACFLLKHRSLQIIFNI